MSLLAIPTVYQRARGVLSRDTGLQVVLLPAKFPCDFILLGGGGAAIWRLLETPLTAGEIAERFDRATCPDERELTSCLSDMVGKGVLDLEDSA